MRSWLRTALHESRYQPVGVGATATPTGAVGLHIARSATPLPELSAARLARYYAVDPVLFEATAPALIDVYAPLAADDETQTFLDSCQPSFIMSFLATILRLFLSVTDTNGLLRRGSMFVLSSGHARELLEGPLREAREAAHDGGGGGRLRLLDIGAGDGEVTAKLAPLFDEVHATEVSPYMASRLRGKGYTTTVTSFIGPDVFPHAGQFDVVAAMNLLDRCDHPADMLRDAVRLLRPGTGRLLLAVVLPFSEFVEEGTRKRRVFGPLPMNGARCQGA